MRVYLSGPITGVSDYKYNFRRAKKDAEDWLKEKYRDYEDIEIINPARISIEDGTHEEYMKLCLTLLEECKMIFMLPEWRKSCGACQEYGYARAMGIKIVEL